MKMNRYVLHLLSLVLIACSVLAFSSCNDDNGPKEVKDAEQTLLLFYPWSNNLTSDFENNIEEFKSVIANNILKNERVLVCFASSSSKASLFELKYHKNQCIVDTLQRYDNITFTSDANISSLLVDVKKKAPAHKYSMIIGGHGMGWLQVPDLSRASVESKMSYHWNVPGEIRTRYFGGTNSSTQINTTSLAKAIVDAGMKMEYILFDVCYMSNIETVYDLKDVANYIIGCPTEIMAYGFPYQKLATYLLGSVDYEAICNTYFDFYTTYSTPCGTIAVTKCSELDALAAIMKQINAKYQMNDYDAQYIQRMDGYYPVLFYDFGDYVRRLCADPELLSAFDAQYEKVVPENYRKHTRCYYSTFIGQVEINTYSGLTTSESSTNTKAAKYAETAWFKATH